MLCASFDIGKKNFSFCVEMFDNSVHYNFPSKNKRYHENGTPFDDFDNNVLNKIYMNGKILLLENVDITSNCDSKCKLDPNTFHNMTDVLDRYSKFWDMCSVFIIEKQMQFGNRVNPMAIKLGQHCYSYFAIKYANFKDIVEFPAYHKTQILGAAKILKNK